MRDAGQPSDVTSFGLPPGKPRLEETTPTGSGPVDGPRGVRTSSKAGLRYWVRNPVLHLGTYFALLLAYRFFIEPVYAYAGFYWEPQFGKIGEGAGLVLMTSLLLPRVFTRPSECFLHLQFFLPVLPMLVLYGAMDLPRAYVICSLAAFVSMILTVRIVRISYVPWNPLPFSTVQIILAVCATLTILSIIAAGGLTFFNLNVLDVYEFRRSSATNLPAFFAYISPWASTIFLPASIILAVLKKERLFAALAGASVVVMFGLTAIKSTLVYPLLALSIFYLLSRKKNIPVFLSVTFISIAAFSYLTFALNPNETLFGTLFLRRAIFVPALNNFYHYDFFSTHEFMYWADSRLSLGAFKNVYGLKMASLVGFEYAPSKETVASTGWLGTGYAQLGFAGQLVYGVAIGFLFSIFDAYGRRIGDSTVAALVAPPTIVMLLHSDFPTALATHGVLVAIILFAVLPPAFKTWKTHAAQAATAQLSNSYSGAEPTTGKTAG